MLDYNLEQSLHGKRFSSEKTANHPPSRLEKLKDQRIVQLVNELAREESPDPLLSEREHLHKIEQELRSAVAFDDFRVNLKLAVACIKNGRKYLDESDFIQLIENFFKGVSHLDRVTWNDLQKKTLLHIMELNGATMQSLALVGGGLYQDGLYLESLAVFSLLSALNPENQEYWYRVGIVAQKCDKLDLAIRAYAAANYLEPDLFGAHLFSAVCLNQIGQNEEAIVEYKEAKRIAAISPNDKEQLRLIGDLETLLAAKHVT